MKRVTTPTWLGKSAKAKFKKLVKSLPDLSDTQLDYVAMMADSFSLYQSATAELRHHVETTGSVSVPGSTGNLTPHPALKVKNQARTAYIATCKALLSSLKESDNIQEIRDEITDIGDRFRSLEEDGD